MQVAKMQQSSPSYIAFTIKNERKKANLTQKRLAELTGLGLKTIRKIEQDDQGVSLKNVNLVLNFFGLELGPKSLVGSSRSKRKELLTKDKILNTLRGVLPIFKARFGIESLSLFGSFAYSEETEESDIDILFEGNVGLSEEGEMVLILEHLFKGYDIDFTNKARLDPRLRDSILENLIEIKEGI